MSQFDRLKVRVKVRLPVLVLAVFTVGIAGFSLYILQGALRTAHIERVQAFVASAKSVAQENYNLAQEGVISEAFAKTKARDAIRAMRFGEGSRVFVFNENGIRVVSNEIYQEGTSAWKASQTKSMIRNALAGGGITHYHGARVRNGVREHSLPKAAWSEYFEPWGWVIASAVYLDDVAAAFWDNLLQLGVVLVLVGTVVGYVANQMIGNITKPLSELTANMKKLASDEVNVKIEGVNRGDELGEMAAAMETLVVHETQRLALREQLEMQAYSDSLTGLSNRSVFHSALGDMIKAALASDEKCALMIVDLDRFKTINDTLGHFAGDAVLMEVGKRLENVVGDSGLVGRLSGDEFYIVQGGLASKSEALDLGQRIVGAMQEAMNLEGHPVHVGASIGLAIGPDDSVSESKLYRFADMALYAAKQSGGSQVQSYTREMGVEAQERYDLEILMKESLKAGHFQAHFQAKVDLSSGAMVGAEALCRWTHPKRGMISPADFIPVAEESGLIHDIGYLMLKQSCEFAKVCNQEAQDPFVVAVNVSAKQLLFGRFLATLGRCLEETGCRAEWIELEITESLLLNDCDSIVTMLETISNMGISIAIDDFGTGYSAMSYLSRFPISCLKVDQSFVRDMCSDSQKQVLVSAILAMANGLGLKTVAEGVEDEQTAQALAALSCGIGQGYHWHRPSTSDELLQKLDAQRAIAA